MTLEQAHVQLAKQVKKQLLSKVSRIASKVLTMMESTRGNRYAEDVVDQRLTIDEATKQIYEAAMKEVLE